MTANIPYELSFDYAGRPGRKTGDNQMGYTVIDAGGQTIFSGTIIAENNSSKTPVWQTAKTVFTPTTSGSLLVRFEGQGTDNTFGMLIDNTVLVKAQVESAVDLDIDSNNDNRLLAPDRSPLEDDIEGDQAKKIVINDNDTDGDGVPDYADGFGYGGLPETQQGIAGKGFAPIVLQIPENLPLSSCCPAAESALGVSARGDIILHSSVRACGSCLSLAFERKWNNDRSRCAGGACWHLRHSRCIGTRFRPRRTGFHEYVHKRRSVTDAQTR